MVDSLLIANGIVAVPDPSRPRVLYGYDVLVQHGRIAAVGPHGTLRAGSARTLDAAGMLVLPGFVNLHTHLYSTFARGLMRKCPGKQFAEILENLWWCLDKALDRDAIYFSAMTVLLETIRAGTTTLIDHHSSPSAVRGSLGVLAKAVQDTGVRTCLCYEVSDRDGPEAMRDGVEENLAFLGEVTGEGLLRGLFGIHASFTLSEATMGVAAEAGRKAGAGFHLHVAESPIDQDLTRKRTGLSVVERLEKAGILGDRTVAAHAVHVSGREMDILASTGTVVAHNPQSNMNNAVGVADVAGLLHRGVAVGLGTDGMTFDMRQELRAGILAQRLHGQDASAGFKELSRALWHENPRAVSRLWNRPIGTLEEGSAADIIIADYKPATPLMDGSLIGHLVFGLPSARIVTTIVDGRVLMHEGALELDIDENEVMAKSREAAERVWKRLDAPCPPSRL